MLGCYANSLNSDLDCVELNAVNEFIVIVLSWDSQFGNIDISCEF